MGMSLLTNLIEPHRQQDPHAWRELGWKCIQQNRRDLAEECFLRLVELDPTLVEAWANLGTFARSRREFPLAVQYYTKAAELEPTNHRLVMTLISALREMRAPEVAVSWCERILGESPNSVDCLLLMGNLHQELDQYDIAMAYLAKALELQPENPHAWNALGIVHHRQGNIADGIRYFREALRRDPANQEFCFHLGMGLLLAGEFREGWEMFEHRPGGRYCRRHQRSWRLWNGELLQGRTLLLAAEQGFGDTIQGIQFAGTIHAQYGGNLIVSCQARLKPLLSRVPGICGCVSRDESHPPFDYFIPILSIPSVLRLEPRIADARVPYLHPDPARHARWRDYLQSKNRGAGNPAGIKVGISWQGDPAFAADRARSIPLAFFSCLAEIPTISLFSLQKGYGTEQVANISWANRVHQFEVDFDGPDGAFVDSVAILKSLDLFVTSDSALAHVAGAAGVPTWILLPRVPDWRWGMEGTSTAWYPSARLFRQARLGDWKGVFQDVIHAIGEKGSSLQWS